MPPQGDKRIAERIRGEKVVVAKEINIHGNLNLSEGNRSKPSKKVIAAYLQRLKRRGAVSVATRTVVPVLRHPRTRRTGPVAAH